MSKLTVREIGEFGLIAALRDALPPKTVSDYRLHVGIGDDAAIWSPAPTEALVITTDTLVEGVHFRLEWTDWRSLGHKLLAVNLSDLAAMGATPKLAVITLALRGSERVDDLRKMYAGVGTLARRHSILIAGGDIVSSPEALTINVTALGHTRHGRFLPRAGAKPGDLIAVSGTLGASAAGYQLLLADGQSRRAATADELIAAHLRPEPRVQLGRVLSQRGATSAMDLSDGLFGDLPKILAASKVGAIIDEAAIPVAAAVRALFPGSWFDLATRGGEDYELLFTVKPDLFSQLQWYAAEAGSTVTAIGEITERASGPTLRLRDAGGSLHEIAPGAFDHFA